MKNKLLLLGDEALALGAINAGLSGAYAYPGTPSTEILEYVQNNPVARLRKIHSHWSSNEKTAVEEALGMSFCGKRAIVSMKHVGLNVAADPFMNSAMTGANGGLLVISADDPSMHSSQNEQDSPQTRGLSRKAPARTAATETGGLSFTYSRKRRTAGYGRAKPEPGAATRGRRRQGRRYACGRRPSPWRPWPRRA